MTVPTKRKLAQAFTIRGQLRHVARVFVDAFDDRVAELQINADIEYKGKSYPAITLLTLEIDGNQDVGWKAFDRFTRFLPYMKPVKDFRQFLARELIRIRDTDPKVENRSPSCPLWMGIGAYVRELDEFGELRSLALQARQAVESLHDEVRSARKTLPAGSAQRNMLEVRIRNILKVAGQSPSTEQLFKVTKK
ncbi:MAG: hypothetical protein AAB917_00085 [Patescibacteria group bacterium]